MYHDIKEYSFLYPGLFIYVLTNRDLFVEFKGTLYNGSKMGS